MSLFSVMVITNFEHMTPEAADLDSVITPEFSPFKKQKMFINPDNIERLEEQVTGFTYKGAAIKDPELGQLDPPKPVVICVLHFTSGYRTAVEKPEFEQFMKLTKPYREQPESKASLEDLNQELKDRGDSE